MGGPGAGARSWGRGSANRRQRPPSRSCGAAGGSAACFPGWALERRVRRDARVPGSGRLRAPMKPERPQPDGGASVGAGAQRLAATHAEPGRAALCEARPDCGLHRLLCAPLRVHLRAALAGAALPPQTTQLPERLPLPLPLLGLAAYCALLLLLPRLRGCQLVQPFRLLAALLLPRVSAVLHPHAYELILHPGESRESRSSAGVVLHPSGGGQVSSVAGGEGGGEARVLGPSYPQTLLAGDPTLFLKVGRTHRVTGSLLCTSYSVLMQGVPEL